MTAPPAPTIEVDFPESVTSMGHGKLRLRFSSDIQHARVVFRFDRSRLWLTGDGKLATSDECAFEFQFPDPQSARDRELEIGIKGKLEADSREPIEVYASIGRKSAVTLVKSGAIELQMHPKNGISALWRRTLAFLDALKKYSVAAATGLLAMIFAVLTLAGILPAIVEEGLIAAGVLRPYFEADGWEYKATEASTPDWSLKAKWQRRELLLPPSLALNGQRIRTNVVDVTGTGPSLVAVPKNLRLHDFTFQVSIWDPVGAGWVVRSQDDRRLGYFFWIDNATTVPTLRGCTVFRPLWSKEIASEDLIGKAELPFERCCGPNDVLLVEAEVSDYSFKYWLRHKNYVELKRDPSIGATIIHAPDKILESLIDKKSDPGKLAPKSDSAKPQDSYLHIPPYVTFTDHGHHFHSGGFGFTAQDGTKGMTFEFFSVKAGPVVSLWDLAEKYAHNSTRVRKEQ